MSDKAKNLNDASLMLDGYMELDPRDQENFIAYYVDRYSPIDNLVREASQAKKHQRNFCWFFTGFTGAGKSTELNRIVSDTNLTKNYLPIRIDISEDLNVSNIEYTDIILVMAKACATLAEQIKCPISKDIRKHIFYWGKEIITENESQYLIETEGALGISTPFFSLSDKVKTDEKKRQIIRERIYNDVTRFISLLDDLTGALMDYSQRQVLCILDGLDHVDYKPCLDLFNNYYATLIKPRLSKIFVIHVCMLHDQHFGANIDRNRTLLPNIKVYAGENANDLSKEGLRFYKDIISRYVDLNLFAENTLESLFEISAGIVRDMIRLTGIACGYGAHAGGKKLTLDHVQRLWDEETARFRALIESADYDLLKYLIDNPHPVGLNRFGALFHLKAVIFYPNGEGWYGLHPVVRRIINK